MNKATQNKIGGWVSVGVAPCSAPRMTRADAWKKRPVVLKYFAFKEEFKLKCNKLGIALNDEVYLRFHVQIPKTCKKKYKEGQFHQEKPDIDNLCKAVMDSFGINDCRVHTLVASKYWSENPRIEIWQNNC
jgi:Holliday junction resolvase RusA-like endonuclease